MNKIGTKERQSPAIRSLPTDFEKGQVFTPRFLAFWVASLLEERLGTHWNGAVFDPACGDGELLEATKKLLPGVKLLGTDIDFEACEEARSRLGSNASIRLEDALVSSAVNGKTCEQSIGALISNPPWGADLLHSTVQLRSLGYSLANGQFDSWSLFVEMSLKLLNDEGLAAFILPDAIFSPEHLQSRKFIADNYTIELIARLGEGIFKDVSRGTVILLIRKKKPANSHKVEVFRLSNADRKGVLSGEINLKTVRSKQHHYIPQSRFVRDPRCRWDIDVSIKEYDRLIKIEEKAGAWTELFCSGRGVELSKRGLVKTCKKCGHTIPSPTQPREVICKGCGSIAASESMLSESIVLTSSQIIPGFMPFIVGEDIDRYSLSCSRQIKLAVPGINYKTQDTYSQERLLIRKTGVGLKATVTKSNAATNQVVFHYFAKRPQQSFLLYYVLGVFSSRIMFAYHLRKSGESEWRSHPYVTPKILQELPIPLPIPGSQIWRQAEKISEIVKIHLNNQGKNKKLDLEIEGLVAGLYGFDHTDIRWAKKVICSAQDLEPMRTLGDFDCDSIEPKVVH